MCSSPMGNLVTAGGNVTGRASGGGLVDMYLFQPGSDETIPAEELGCGFGWAVNLQQGGYQNPMPQMTYESLVSVVDAAGGWARAHQRGYVAWLRGRGRQAAQQPLLLEIYNPTADTIGITGPNEVEVITDAPFPAAAGVPNYPFLFQLPQRRHLLTPAQRTRQANGGGAKRYSGRAHSHPGDNQRHGRLGMEQPRYRLEHPGRLRRDVRAREGPQDRRRRQPGGHRPSGSTSASTNPIATPPHRRSSSPGDTNFARHFHNLVLLPDGRVAAIGGNWRGNGGGRRTSQQPLPDSRDPASRPTIVALVRAAASTPRPTSMSSARGTPTLPSTTARCSRA